MAFQGFIKVHEGLLVDGKTLVLLGIRDLDTGRVVRNRVRVFPDAAPGPLFEAFLDAHAEAPLESIAVPPALLKGAPAAFPVSVVPLGNASARAAVLLPSQ